MLSCLLAAFYQFALFFFYFFYFLFKGKPEWQKIGQVERCCTTNNCCLHNPKVQTDASISPKQTENMQTTNEQQTNFIKTGVSWRENKQTESTTTTTTTATSKFQIFQKMNSYQQLSEQYANKMAQTFQNLYSAFYNFLKYIGTIVVHFIIWLYSIIYEWLISSGSSTIISGTSTGNILNQKQIQKTTIEKVQENLQQQNEQQQQQHSSSMDANITFQRWPSVDQSVIQPVEFYSRKQIYRSDFNWPTLEDSNVAVTTLPSPPPPPPPPTTPSISLPLPIFKTVTSTTSTKIGEKVPPKGGVAVLPLDIMAEAHARVKEREQKLIEQEAELQKNNEMNNDWTVTSKKFLPAQWKMPISKIDEKSMIENKESEDGEILRSTRRNIVSRISRTTDQDAQFIFHAPTHQNVTNFRSNRLTTDGNFLMGRSVFSPIREAEEMRDRVNRRMTETPSETFFSSRLNTPLDDFSMTSRINTPFEVALDSQMDSFSRYPTSRSRSQSRIHTVISPPPTNQMHSPRRDETGINMLRQRSRTVEPRLAEGTVKALTRQWPPESNATGVFVAKDNWNIIPTEIVSCRRVMERSVTDKWITRDEKGDIMDEFSMKSWEGENDGLRRRDNGTGETWHRKVEISTDGKTSFVDNRRFYTRDYVVESETRNA
uniref:Bm6565 n=1 Tax=Wuchereria bancrofti TaxID=6293 RepID=A0AAF5PW37_WUCBA